MTRVRTLVPTRVGTWVRTLVRGLLPALVCLPAFACGASRFDRLYDAGDFQRAIALFEADQELQDQERALYRAARIRSRPDSPTFDPEAARGDLERLLELHPRSSYREAAAAQLALLEELVRLRREAARREATVASLDGEVAALRQRSERLEEELGESEERIELLRLVVDALREDLEARERRLAELERELERLKAIDLAPPRPSAPP